MNQRTFFTSFLFILWHIVIQAQINVPLPPVTPWSGKSETLIVSKNDVWATVAEKTDFEYSATYAETRAYFEKLVKKSSLLSLKVIGQTASGYEIFMIKASKEAFFHKNNTTLKPTFLAQAGIHAGEIDGKDAGMMLLRDIAIGKKKDLLDDINFLFIPILNVDGHERVSPYNRINQRGPTNMGWRTNAKNQNLNRDYCKLDTKELKAVLGVINMFKPDLYMDIHVTDGADYQYDITYGYIGQHGYSPNISKWLSEQFRPNIDKTLKSFGHIPGPLLFSKNDADFTEGNMDYTFSPDFSHAYGDARHLPAILIENHSLKPYKQRVLGTYILLEATLKFLANQKDVLQKAIKQDVSLKKDSLVLSWTFPNEDTHKKTNNPWEAKPTQPTLDSMLMLGKVSTRVKSDVTNTEYVKWTTQNTEGVIPVFKNNIPNLKVAIPQAYIIPAAYEDIIKRLESHGILMEKVHKTEKRWVELSKIDNPTYAKTPFEGHIKMSGSVRNWQDSVTVQAGSVLVKTDQPLGNLAVLLLEPNCGSSYFQWGFMMEIVNRTEYIEEYIMAPYAKIMLAESPILQQEFDVYKTTNPKPREIMDWFYKHTPFVDSQYLVYPIVRLR